jgi:hypothetical protein
MCMKELNFGKQIETNVNLAPSKKIIMHKVTQLQLAITSSCEVKILSSTILRKVTKFSRILVFRDLPDFLWN